VENHDPKSSSFAEGERREEIIVASRENLRHALRAALLMLPGEFSAEELYTAIAALSYNGDWRMVFGENPFKVSNIVAAQISLFHSLSISLFLYIIYFGISLIRFSHTSKD
jgi:hypothetical protein